MCIYTHTYSVCKYIYLICLYMYMLTYLFIYLYVYKNVCVYKNCSFDMILWFIKYVREVNL